MTTSLTSLTPMQELAQQTLAMLDKQQAYFVTDLRIDAERKGQLLQESKQLERELRARCTALLATQATPSLFDVMEEAR